MALGSDESCREEGLVSRIQVSDTRSSPIFKKENAYLNCCVINEKIRICALESTNTTSSLPHTDDSCRIETSAWLYH